MRPIAPSIRAMTVAAAAAASTGVAKSSALQQSLFFVYRLGNSLYVPLTSRCNSLTLPQLRGDGFSLPTPVVAALCRVREAELNNGNICQTDGVREWYHESNGACDGDLLPPKTKLPPPPHRAVAALPPLCDIGGDTASRSKGQEREPRLDDLLREIRGEFRYATAELSETSTTKEKYFSRGTTIESIVISGEGEPTLRLGDTIELVRAIKSFIDTLPAAPDQPPPAIRLTTNGLVAPRAANELSATSSDGSSLPQLLWDCGVSRISVGLNTWNAEQYNDLVRPVLLSDASRNGFDTVCDFIKDAVEVDGDLEVETTAIDRPDVDKAKTEALAEALGVTTPMRWRPYFP